MFASVEGHLEGVKFPIQLYVLRRETQHIQDFGSCLGPPEALVKIIVVVEKDAARA